MSKSVLLSTSQTRACEAETKLDFGDDLLNVLWPAVRQRALDLPILWRIVQDLYGDFLVIPSELNSLRDEIERLLKAAVFSYDITIWLDLLQSLATLGVEHELTLFGIAD